jgi:quercetin 2,3-dioxygenase
MSTRTLINVIESVPTSDGAGVKLRRSLGHHQQLRLDPFLMLDEFFSDNPDDYIAGFPPHPHRGFETVTYMLDGHMRHEDHMGNVGNLKSGAVQWMTAGRGIIHSEMPQQTKGRVRGFQLWINLPANEKMKPASYRDIEPREIPLLKLTGGGQAKVIAGTLEIDGQRTSGPIQGLRTDPLFADIELPGGREFSHPVPADYNVFLYPYEGDLNVGAQNDMRPLKRQSAGILSHGDRVHVQAQRDARFLILAGRPLGEPIVQYGPFVMNTREEVEQAVRDFQRGELTRPVL